MIKTTLWIKKLCQSSIDLHLIVNKLQAEGLRAREPLLEFPSGPGILFFDEITKALLFFLESVCCRGIDRILAVCLNPSCLKNGLTWKLLDMGVSDIIFWQYEDGPAPIQIIVDKFKRWETVDGILHSPVVQKGLIGHSPRWVSTLCQVTEVAYFTQASVLITGESGTGKELVARLIHSLDQRPDKKDLILLDCSTINPDLSGSEFFGHERGAFTGAVASREGAFAMANKGTLFLDEVGELPHRLQAELLRVVQEQTYKKLGSNEWQKTEFRLICATNRDLIEDEAKGLFRRDFYFRIAGWSCKLPPLRERHEDIIPLVKYFIRSFMPGIDPVLDDAVTNYFLLRDYPGNVRDLKHAVARMVYRHVGSGPFTAGDIPEEERPRYDQECKSWCDSVFDSYIARALAMGLGLKEIGRTAEQIAMRIAVENAEDNLSVAAERLGVNVRTVQKRTQDQRQGR